jgi:hypothetical protein
MGWINSYVNIIAQMFCYCKGYSQNSDRKMSTRDRIFYGLKGQCKVIRRIVV